MSKLNRSLLVALALVLGRGSLAIAAEGPVFVRLTTQPGEMLGVFFPGLAPHQAVIFVYLSRMGYYTGIAFQRIVPGLRCPLNSEM